MKHYTYFRSSAAYRVRIALNLKGIAPEPISIHLTKDGGKQHSPEYRAVNPQRRVPSLVLDDGEVLTQSPGHHRVSRRDPSEARVPAGRSGRARQGARLRRADRLRHSPAQQPCPAAISQARAQAGAAGDRRMVSALGDRGLHRARNHDPARPLLFRRQRHARRHLSRAADVQRAAAQGSAGCVSEARRGGCRIGQSCRPSTRRARKTSPTPSDGAAAG